MDHQTANTTLAFIGTYTQKEGHVDGKGAGVSIYTSGPSSSDWVLQHSFSDIINPSYLCLSPKLPIIYAVSEQGPDVPEPKSVIKVIEYDPKTYSMKALQTISAQGHAPCYISTDAEGRAVYLANYVSGNVLRYKIKSDGTLESGIPSQHNGTGPHSRQEAPHAHYIKPHRDGYVYAVDLGIDQVLRYQDTPKGLQATDTLQVETGGGPRHLCWHPRQSIVYILNELSGSIEAWKWQDSIKVHQETITLNPLPDQRFAGGADIHISKDGLFLYASLRGNFDEVIVLKTQPNLSIIQRVPAGGSVPRNMALSLSEDYLAVASQDEDRICLFKKDAQTGLLEPKPEVVDIKTPVCIVFKKLSID